MIVCADNMDPLVGLPSLADASVDAIVTDPPAGIAFMGKAWDTDKGGRDQWIAWLAGVMRECLRVLKPGGHALVWALPRTSHWTATAVEDAGFEIRDVVMHLFGTGFPKSLDVSKAIDARGGVPHLASRIGAAIRDARVVRGMTIGDCDRRFCDGTTNWSWFEGRPSGQRTPTPATFARIVAEWPELATLASMVAAAHRDVVGRSTNGIAGSAAEPDAYGFRSEFDITAPATPAAAQWSGWGTALKPAAEHWILARKPLDGTIAACVLKHGTGALNIDGTRIGTEQRINPPAGNKPGGVSLNMSAVGMPTNAAATVALGRWPANVTLDEDAADVLDEQSGERRAGNNPSKRRGIGYTETGGGGNSGTASIARATDSGGASRFFYVAKGSRSEKTHGGTVDNKHPTVKSIALMRWLVRLIAPPGGLVLDPFAGSGTTGVAALAEGMRFMGMERDEQYAEIAAARIATTEAA